VQLVLQRARGGAAPGGVRVLAYVCDGISFRAEVAEASVLLFLPGRSLRLAAVKSASGAKYEDGGSSFWSKGDEARLTLDGVGYGGCRLQSRPLP
jgi:putative lipoprotein